MLKQINIWVKAMEAYTLDIDRWDFFVCQTIRWPELCWYSACNFSREEVEDENAKQIQIHFTTCTNTVHKMYKYISQGAPIHFTMWTNTFQNLNTFFFDMDKYSACNFWGGEVGDENSKHKQQIKTVCIIVCKLFSHVHKLKNPKKCFDEKWSF